MIKASLLSRVYRPITAHCKLINIHSLTTYAQFIPHHELFSLTSVCTFRPQNMVLLPLSSRMPLPSSPTSQCHPVLSVGHRPNATISVKLSSTPPELFFFLCASTIECTHISGSISRRGMPEVNGKSLDTLSPSTRNLGRDQATAPLSTPQCSLCQSGCQSLSLPQPNLSDSGLHGEKIETGILSILVSET